MGCMKISMYKRPVKGTERKLTQDYYPCLFDKQEPEINQSLMIAICQSLKDMEYHTSTADEDWNHVHAYI